MPEGKYFVIKSHLSGGDQNLILDVAASNRDAGSEVLIWNQNDPPTDNQLWWEDHFHSTIRTKMNDYCLDMLDGKLVINPFKPGKEQQRWFLLDNCIRLRGNHDSCLDVEGGSADPGAKVLSWSFHGNDNQRWTFEPRQPDYFYIQSRLNEKVMDINAGDPSSGTDIIMWNKKDEAEDNQLWYEGKSGCICSKLNDFTLDCSNDTVKMEPLNIENDHQGFHFHGDNIIKRGNRNSCLDIIGENTDDGATICCYDNKDQDNQKWTRVYV